MKLLILWFALVAVLHYVSGPTHGLKGTVMTMLTIIAITVMFICWELKNKKDNSTPCP